MPKQTAAKKEDLEEPLQARARAFSNLYQQATSSPAVLLVIVDKLWEAVNAWAIMKMGLKRNQYLAEDMRDFAILCTLRALLTGQKIEEVVKGVNFELPLKLTGKRAGFTELLPGLYTTAWEYEMVCSVVKQAKSGAWNAPQFRYTLRERLEGFAEEQKLKPLARDKLEALLKPVGLRTPPSQIAAAYVGKRHATSPANIKKLVGIVRDPTLKNMLGKYLKRHYRSPDFEAMLRQLTEGVSPPAA